MLRIEWVNVALKLETVVVADISVCGLFMHRLIFSLLSGKMMSKCTLK